MNTTTRSSRRQEAPIKHHTRTWFELRVRHSTMTHDPIPVGPMHHKLSIARLARNKYRAANPGFNTWIYRFTETRTLVR